jgi:penicillin-insensitive murein endopeptidase
MSTVNFTRVVERGWALRASWLILLAATGCARERMAPVAAPVQRGPLIHWVVNEARPVAPAPCTPGAGAACATAAEDATKRAPEEDEEPLDVRPHPLAAKTTWEIDDLVRRDLASLGSMSFGTPTRGGLLNAIRLPESDRWELVHPATSWGTEETVSYLAAAVDAVRTEFPSTPPIYVGNISAQRGGRLKPHVSHQAGEDVDVGYYYTVPVEWYTRATPANLDRPRTWAFIRALLSKTDVRYIFIDTRVQRLLREYAESIGEDPQWLEGIFKGGPDGPAVIRHAPGHATHIHVRFYNPIAGETARRCYGSLVRYGKVLPSNYFIQHRVKKGDTLIGIAKRYRVTVDAIKRANGMRGNVIQANKAVKVPQQGSVTPPGRGDTQVPPRRRPPRPPTGRIAAR